MKRASHVGRRAKCLSCIAWCMGLLSLTAGGTVVQAHLGLDRQIKSLDRRIANHPKSPVLWANRATLHLRHGSLALARRDWRALRRLAPFSEPTVRLGLRIAWKDGRDAEVGARLFRYFLCYRGSWLMWRWRARWAVRHRRWKEAIEAYDRVLGEVATPGLFLERGRLQERLGHWREASLGYRDGLQRLQGAVVLRLSLIRTETRRRRYVQALALIAPMLRRLPMKAEWWLRRADVYEAAGQHELALRDRLAAYKEAAFWFRLRPTAFHRLRRAKAAMALGRRAEAMRDVTMVVKAFPRWVQARELLHKWKKQRKTQP